MEKLIKICFKKISNMKEKLNSDGSAAIACNNKFDIQGVVLVTATKRNPKDRVLNSGCSIHVCPIKEWFTKFDDRNGGQVQM